MAVCAAAAAAPPVNMRRRWLLLMMILMIAIARADEGQSGWRRRRRFKRENTIYGKQNGQRENTTEFELKWSLVIIISDFSIWLA